MSKQLEFIVGGRVVTAAQLDAIGKAQKKRKATKDAPDEFHKGFRVEGYAPGHIAEAKAKADAECAEWERMPDAERKGLKPPVKWSEAGFVATHRRKPVGRLYSIPSAADECARLATAAGWQYVRVVALERRNEQ